MTTIDLETTDRTQTEGIRAILNLDGGHVAMEGETLLIAQTHQALQHWLVTENRRAEPEDVEPVTALVQEATVIEAIETLEEEATSTDTDDESGDGSAGDAPGEMDGPDMSHGPATRNQVLTRIKTRAKTTATTSGRRNSRRRNPAGRSII